MQIVNDDELRDSSLPNGLERRNGFIKEDIAEEVVEEFASFPNGSHDDLVDSSTQALIRFRQGGFISLFSDEEEEPFDERRKAQYY